MTLVTKWGRSIFTLLWLADLFNVLRLSSVHTVTPRWLARVWNEHTLAVNVTVYVLGRWCWLVILSSTTCCLTPTGLEFCQEVEHICKYTPCERILKNYIYSLLKCVAYLSMFKKGGGRLCRVELLESIEQLGNSCTQSQSGMLVLVPRAWTIVWIYFWYIFVIIECFA